MHRRGDQMSSQNFDITLKLFNQAKEHSLSSQDIQSLSFEPAFKLDPLNYNISIRASTSLLNFIFNSLELELLPKTLHWKNKNNNILQSKDITENTYQLTQRSSLTQFIIPKTVKIDESSIELSQFSILSDKKEKSFQAVKKIPVTLLSKHERYHKQIQSENQFQFSYHSFQIKILLLSEFRKVQTVIKQRNLILNYYRVSKAKFVQTQKLKQIFKASNPDEEQQFGLLSMDQVGRIMVQDKSCRFPTIGIWQKSDRSITRLETYHQISQYLSFKDKKCRFRHEGSSYIYFVKFSQNSTSPEIYLINWVHPEKSDEEFGQFLVQRCQTDLPENYSKSQQKNQEESTGFIEHQVDLCKTLSSKKSTLSSVSSIQKPNSQHLLSTSRQSRNNSNSQSFSGNFENSNYSAKNYNKSIVQDPEFHTHQKQFLQKQNIDLNKNQKSNSCQNAANKDIEATNASFLHFSPRKNQQIHQLERNLDKDSPVVRIDYKTTKGDQAFNYNIENMNDQSFGEPSSPAFRKTSNSSPEEESQCQSPKPKDIDDKIFEIYSDIYQNDNKETLIKRLVRKDLEIQLLKTQITKLRQKNNSLIPVNSNKKLVKLLKSPYNEVSDSIENHHLLSTAKVNKKKLSESDLNSMIISSIKQKRLYQISNQKEPYQQCENRRKEFQVQNRGNHRTNINLKQFLEHNVNNNQNNYVPEEPWEQLEVVDLEF